MTKMIFLSTVAAFSLVAGVASAATLTNLDKTDASVKVTIGAKTETVVLKENAIFDTKGKDASFVLGTEKAVSAKSDEKLTIKSGKIDAVTAAPLAAVKGDVKAETAAPAAGKAEVSTTTSTTTKDEVKK